MLLTNGLQLTDELEVEDSSPVHGPVLRSDGRRSWDGMESRAATMLDWRLSFARLTCSSVLLGTNVEGVGSGVGYGKHGVGVVVGVRGAESWTELGLNILPQFLIFISVDVLGERPVWDGRLEVDGGPLADVHTDGEPKPQVLGRREVTQQLEVRGESTARFVRKDVIDTGGARFFGPAVPPEVGTVRVIVLFRETRSDIGPT